MLKRESDMFICTISCQTRKCQIRSGHSVGRGKGALAAELVWWRATGPSSATKTSTDCYVTRTHENQGTPSPSVALECKCAFGAKIFFVFDSIYGRRKMCTCGAHLRFQGCEIECGPRSLAVDNGSQVVGPRVLDPSQPFGGSGQSCARR